MIECTYFSLIKSEMGCVSSKVLSVDASIQTNEPIVEIIQNISDYSEGSSPSVKDQKISQYGDGDQDMSILPTISEAAEEIRNAKNSSSTPSPPSSQSHELTIDPINIIVDDEAKAIESYIKTAVEYRNEHGGRCDLNVQLKKQRLELICVGSFILKNREKPKYEIISYDSYIPNSKLKYRPDLILRDYDTKMIVHVEIDEKAHNAYDSDAEKKREEEIAKHFCKYNYMRIRFNPNVYGSKVEMAIAFTQMLFFNDGLLSVQFRKKSKN